MVVKVPREPELPFAFRPFWPHAELGVALDLGDVHEVGRDRAVAALSAVALLLAAVLLAALLLTALLLTAVLLLAALLLTTLLLAALLLATGLTGVRLRGLRRAGGQLAERGVELAPDPLDVDADPVDRGRPLLLQGTDDGVLDEAGVVRLGLSRRGEPGVGLGDLLVEVGQFRGHPLTRVLRHVRQLLTDVGARDGGHLRRGGLGLVLRPAVVVGLVRRSVEVRPDKPAPAER
ncbi:hypothetical protein M2162_005854 [Streptomyces sp. SAI-041]|nr:hypothetical protein [Streptomyces sp. SAI-041]